MASPLPDQIAKIKAKQDQLAVRLAALQSKAKTADRKRDTRRKIVVGAAVLGAIENDPDLAASVRRVLAATITRDQDKALLTDLLAL